MPDGHESGRDGTEQTRFVCEGRHGRETERNELKWARRGFEPRQDIPGRSLRCRSRERGSLVMTKVYDSRTTLPGVRLAEFRIRRVSLLVTL